MSVDYPWGNLAPSILFLPLLQAFFMSEKTRQGNKEKAQNQAESNPRTTEQSTPLEIPLWLRSAGSIGVQRALAESRGKRPAMINFLQRTCGNKAVNRLLASDAFPAAPRAGQPVIQREDEEDAEEKREALQKRKAELESEYGAIKATISESLGFNLPGSLAELIANGDPDAVIGQLKKHIQESAIEKHIASTDFSWVLDSLVDKEASGDSAALSDMRSALHRILQSDMSFKDKIATAKALENQYGGRFIVEVMGPGGERQRVPASQILTGAFQRSETWFSENKQQTVDSELQKLGNIAREYLQVQNELSGGGGPGS